MNRKKKNGFFRFCFSCLPGAGEMYLGFMKMGLSLMGLFWGLLGVYAVLNIDTIMFLIVPLWFYSFFHVHNLAGLDDEEFRNTEDEFLFNLDTFFLMDKKNVQKYRKVIAAILIVVGVVLLWNGVKDVMVVYLPETVWRLVSRLENTVPQILVGIGIIIAGFHMIKGKQEELKEIIVDVTQESTVEKAGMSPQNADIVISGVPERSSGGEEC